jgi:signal transduction histidine kinase
MNTNSTHSPIARQVHQPHDELDYFVRALSHDMNANFMLLEHSFSRLKQALSAGSRAELDQGVTHVDACLRESKRFLSDLVTLARTGSVDMEPTLADLSPLVNEVLFEQRELLLDRNVRVDILHPLSPVRCNRRRLKQVITNLIRNAVKHGCDPHQPRITISSDGEADSAGEPAGSGYVSIRIHDNGPGIDPRFAERIFLPGQRLPQASGDGSGMGLAIVRKIVEYYGGTVRVDFQSGPGTALVVSLPTGSVGTVAAASKPLSGGSAEDDGHRLGRDASHDDHRLHPHQTYSRLGSPRRSP